MRTILIRLCVATVLLLLGLAPVLPSDAAEEIRIGVLSPMTGPNAKFGAIQRNTLTMAAEDVNQAGGIKSMGGAKIRLVFGGLVLVMLLAAEGASGSRVVLTMGYPQGKGLTNMVLVVES